LATLTAQSADTALFILRELARAGYLYQEDEPSCVPRKLTFKGYERLQQIQATGRNSETGFVAMSFSIEQLPVWEKIIEPAVWDAGYRPFRIDRYEHTHRIDDEIIAQIKRCRFLVADFTEQKAGVYFEAGLALGLGRNVFWMCKDSEKEKLHFDTRQYNHILYDDFAIARKDLTNRIVANEGPGNSVRPEPQG
jgi:nucleoside 2-deoxyribosyltransferase